LSNNKLKLACVDSIGKFKQIKFKASLLHAIISPRTT